MYLKRVSTGDFSEASASLLGPEAPGLSETTITRLKGVWEADYDQWRKRSLEGILGGLGSRLAEATTDRTGDCTPRERGWSGGSV